MQSSLEYNQIALVLDPTNDYYRSELGPSHAFLADAQIDVCDLEGALKARTDHVTLERSLLEAAPENNDRVRRMFYALSGYAGVREFQGQISEAMASLEEALKLLEANLHLSTNHRETTVDILNMQRRLVRMMALNGDTGEAWARSNAMSEKWLELQGIDQEDMRTALIYISFLITRVWLANINGENDLADHLLGDIQTHLASAKSNKSFKRESGNLLVEASFQHWEINNELPPANILSQLPDYVAGSGRTRACVDASRAVIKALMLGQQAQAREFSEYLLRKGYREAEFMRVCRQYSLCSG